MASQVADILQITLMRLSLDRVSVGEDNHSPSSPPIPQLLVSSVEDGLLSNSCPRNHHELPSVCEDRPSNGVIREGKLEHMDKKEKDKEEVKVVEVEKVEVETKVEKTEEQKEPMRQGQSIIYIRNKMLRQGVYL